MFFSETKRKKSERKWDRERVRLLPVNGTTLYRIPFRVYRSLTTETGCRLFLDIVHSSVHHSNLHLEDFGQMSAYSPEPSARRGTVRNSTDVGTHHGTNWRRNTLRKSVFWVNSLWSLGLGVFYSVWFTNTIRWFKILLNSTFVVRPVVVSGLSLE